MKQTIHEQIMEDADEVIASMKLLSEKIHIHDKKIEDFKELRGLKQFIANNIEGKFHEILEKIQEKFEENDKNIPMQIDWKKEFNVAFDENMNYLVVFWQLSHAKSGVIGLPNILFRRSHYQYELWLSE